MTIISLIKASQLQIGDIVRHGQYHAVCVATEPYITLAKLANSLTEQNGGDLIEIGHNRQVMVINTETQEAIKNTPEWLAIARMFPQLNG